MIISESSVGAHKGGATFSADKIQKTPVIVKFETKPTDEIRSSLKSLGLKWNALRQEWEGYTQITKLKEAIEPHRAHIQILDATSLV
ncbi:MAG: hypothetical protein BGO67_02745 [Alphaproteobacteria bacterium 41-28]|nr:MAG: hypothetical protein BGO67_02745 [Alphaproteobacteria bacterium 41-28]